MDRTYLFVPPEEKAEVESLGAQWDTALKCWYIGPTDPPAKFSRWLPPFEDDAELSIVSSDAFVAATTIPCHRCHTNIEVICIHCAIGTVSDELLTRFTVSDVWAMDEELTQQLKPWPTFRRIQTRTGELGSFANHCPHCDAVQDDLDLHSEPDSPFFEIAYDASIELIPLTGTIRLAGDEHFTVE
jgi:hypothetical protein